MDLKREISHSIFSLLDVCTCIQNQAWARHLRAAFLHSQKYLYESWLRSLLPWHLSDHCSILTSGFAKPATKWSEPEFDIFYQSIGKITILKLQRMWFQTLVLHNGTKKCWQVCVKSHLSSCSPEFLTSSTCCILYFRVQKSGLDIAICS